MTEYFNKLNEDRKFGKESEDKNLEIFRTFFNDENLKKTKWQSIMDFESDRCCIELKTRRCEYNKYKDSMIPASKIRYCDGKNKEFYFCFNFQDGLYYWKYDLNEIDKLRYGRGGRFDRSRIEINDYAFIPIDIMKRIEV